MREVNDVNDDTTTKLEKMQSKVDRCQKLNEHNQHASKGEFLHQLDREINKLTEDAQRFW